MPSHVAKPGFSEAQSVPVLKTVSDIWATNRTRKEVSEAQINAALGRDEGEAMT